MVTLEGSVQIIKGWKTLYHPRFHSGSQRVKQTGMHIVCSGVEITFKVFRMNRQNRITNTLSYLFGGLNLLEVSQGIFLRGQETLTMTVTMVLL